MTETKKRGRPSQDRGEKNQAFATLDEMEKQAKERFASGDTKRIPVHGKTKLNWSDQDPDFHYFWATDSETYHVTLQDMVEAGYTFVRHEHGPNRGSQVVKSSKGCNLYLMKQPREYFEEDEQIKHSRALERAKEINQVQAHEYAGSSKEAGKGKVAQLDVQENPEQSIANMLVGDS